MAGDVSSRRSDDRPRSTPGGAAPPGVPPHARSIRTGTLFLLVLVVAVVALMMVYSLLAFVVRPDPAVKAGPMYVTLILTTIAALLMFVLALNSSYLRLMSRTQVPNVQLVMWATGITGIVTGLLTLGRDASPIVMRLVVAGVASAFITVQDARLARARAAAPRPAADGAASARSSRPRGRQRRGGRKH
jgi:hypothetical protein